MRPLGSVRQAAVNANEALGRACALGAAQGWWAANCSAKSLALNTDLGNEAALEKKARLYSGPGNDRTDRFR